jgi:hypothetical protein
MPVDDEAFSLIDAAFMNSVLEMFTSGWIELGQRRQGFLDRAQDPAAAAIQVSKLLIATAMKLREDARGAVAVGQLGESKFSQDLVTMGEAEEKIKQPQTMSAEEQKRIDEARATFLAMQSKSLTKYPTGTKLWTAEATTGSDSAMVRVTGEIRGRPEEFVALAMLKAQQFHASQTGPETIKQVVVEEPNDHNMTVWSQYAAPYVHLPYFPIFYAPPFYWYPVLTSPRAQISARRQGAGELAPLPQAQ